MRIAQLNVNSLIPHLTTVQLALAQYDIDVFAVSETWLTSNSPDILCQIPGYNFIRNDRDLPSLNPKREFMQGGGVACYLREGIKFKIVDFSNNTTINQTEYILIDISISNNRILICVVYRRPDGNVLTNLFKNIQDRSHAFGQVLIVGD